MIFLRVLVNCTVFSMILFEIWNYLSLKLGLMISLLVFSLLGLTSYKIFKNYIKTKQIIISIIIIGLVFLVKESFYSMKYISSEEFFSTKYLIIGVIIGLIVKIFLRREK